MGCGSYRMCSYDGRLFVGDIIGILLLYAASAEMEFLMCPLLGKEEIDTQSLGAEFSGGVEQFDLDIDYVAALACYGCVQRDVVVGGVYGFQITHLHARCDAAGLELAEHYPTAYLVSQSSLYASVKGVYPSLKFGARFPAAYYTVAVLVKFHSQASLAARSAAEAAVAIHTLPRVEYSFHADIFMCRRAVSSLQCHLRAF